MPFHRMRVISSPSISTMGTLIFIFAMVTSQREFSGRHSAPR
jgi:hypothetical protein